MCPSRRGVLAAVGSGTFGAIAGCLTGGSGRQVTSLPAPVLGDPDAPVVVKAYTDFACPHCHEWALEAFPPIRREYVDTGRACYEHHDLPIPVDPKWSWDAAEAGRAVQDRQDDDAYFGYARRMYRQGGDVSADAVRSAANAVGADGEAVLGEARDDTYRPVVEEDRERARDRGVSGTPAVFVAGQQVDPTTDAVAAAIEAAEG